MDLTNMEKNMEKYIFLMKNRLNFLSIRNEHLEKENKALVSEKETLAKENYRIKKVLEKQNEM